MHPSAHTALAASVVTSALGAVVMCWLVFRYGFAPADESPGDSHRRTLVIRIGHAFAGACFAATGMLAVIALSVPAPTVAPSPAAGEVTELAGELRDVDRRVTATETALRRMGAETGRTVARVEDLERWAASARDSRASAGGGRPAAARSTQAAAPPHQWVRVPARGEAAAGMVPSTANESSASAVAATAVTTTAGPPRRDGATPVGERGQAYAGEETRDEMRRIGRNIRITFDKLGQKVREFLED